MSVTTLYDQDVTVLLGSTWNIGAVVVDDLGAAIEFAPPITITPPSGAPAVLYPTLSDEGIGEWSTAYTITLVGRHVAILVSTVGSLAFTAYGETVAPAPLVTLADLRGDRETDLGYLGHTSRTDADITVALAAETDNQRRVCRVPAVYPNDLKEALMRRVARNLAMRAMPLAVLRGDAEAGESVVLPVRDPEIRRLEGPWRRLPMG